MQIINKPFDAAGGAIGVEPYLPHARSVHLQVVRPASKARGIPAPDQQMTPARVLLAVVPSVIVHQILDL
jgi:hypothetical protein